MRISYFEAEGFRNLSRISFTPDDGCTVICGRNAQGKTNLLEAMWVMCGCRSFRGAKEREYIPFGGGRVHLGMRVQSSVRESRAEYSLTPQGRSITLNGVPVKGTSALFELLRCIAFTPTDSELVRGAPEGRRTFLDLAISQVQPDMVAYLRRHINVLHQRNSLLRSLSEGGASDSRLSTLRVWDAQLSQLGAVISHRRYDYLKRLAKVCAELYGTISGGSEKLELKYRSTVYRREELEAGLDDTSAGIYLSRLEANRDYDIRTGTTHSGVSRDDIVITIDGVPAREFASQGQVKSAALVMRLAQARLCSEKQGELPVIFLDDVMGELDERRQRFVFDLIRDMQVFITTPSEASLIPELKGKLVRMENGCLLE